MALHPRTWLPALTLITVCVLTLALPASALAAGPHPVLAQASILGSIFGSIGHAVLGAFTWTVKLAQTFVLTTIGALVKLLIPKSWAHKGAEIMAWLVGVPDYAGKVSTPGGGHQYGFAGINDLRDLFAWLGIAIAPLTVTHAIARNTIDESEPISVPLARLLLVGIAVLTYPYWWAQAAALSDQITHVILGLPSVTAGLNKLMDYAVDGVALGGWQLIDLGLMAAIGIELLMLIFMKVCLILLGAILYAIGPVMIGLVPTRFGHTIARAWASAALFLLGFGIAWATILAVGAVLINDAGTAGPLIAGNTGFGQLVGGLLLAVAGVASIWLCLRIAREIGGLMRMHLGGMLALGAGGFGFRSGGISRGGSAAATPTTGTTMRSFGARVAAAGRAAGGELAGAVPGGSQLQTGLARVGYVGRRGLVGTAGAAVRAAGSKAAPRTEAMLNRTRAGEVAVQMARAGNAARRPKNATAVTDPQNQRSPGSGTGHGRSARNGQPARSRKHARHGTTARDAAAVAAAATAATERRPRPATAAANPGDRQRSDTKAANNAPTSTPTPVPVPAVTPDARPTRPRPAANTPTGAAAPASYRHARPTVVPVRSTVDQARLRPTATLAQPDPATATPLGDDRPPGPATNPSLDRARPKPPAGAQRRGTPPSPPRPPAPAAAPPSEPDITPASASRPDRPRQPTKPTGSQLRPSTRPTPPAATPDGSRK